MSSYHWHRIYRAIYGEMLAATVKRLRFHRGGAISSGTGLDVRGIAKRSSYPNVQPFNRIFKSVHGMLGARVTGKEGGWAPSVRTPRLTERQQTMFDITLRKIEAIQLIGVALYRLLHADRTGRSRPCSARSMRVDWQGPRHANDRRLSRRSRYRAGGATAFDRLCQTATARFSSRSRLWYGERSMAANMQCCATRGHMPTCTNPIGGSLRNGFQRIRPAVALTACCSRSTSTIRARGLFDRASHRHSHAAHLSLKSLLLQRLHGLVIDCGGALT